ncbi:MAG: signal transduction histidine kinase, partial [Crocinitomix sp.]
MKSRKLLNLGIILRFVLYTLIIVLPFIGNSQDLFKTKLIDLNSGLSQNSITAIESDCLGRIWIGTPNSIHYYNGYDLKTIEGVHNRVLKLYQKDSLIYCVTFDALIKINVFNLTKISIQLPARDFYYNQLTSEGIQLISTDILDTLFYDFDLNPIPKEKWGFQYRNVQISTFQMEHTTIRFSLNGLTYTNKNGIDSVLTTVLCTDGVKLDNKLYIASQEGVIEISEVNGYLKSKLLFPNQNIEKLLVDANNNLWIGSVSNGLYLVHNNTLNADYFGMKDHNNSPLVCWMIFEHQDQLYTCSTEGIKPLVRNIKSRKIEDLTQGIAVYSAVSGNNFLLLGTGKKGLLKIENNILSEVYKNDTSALSNVIVYIIRNELGFIATSKTSIIQLDKDGEYLFEMPIRDQNSAYLMHIAERKNEYVSASTYGIELRDDKLNLTKEYRHENARVFCMTSQYKSEIWAVSLDAGLFKIVDDSLISINFPDQHLLTIQSLDSNQRAFWITSSTSAFHYSDNGIKEFNRQNGFPIPEYSQNGIYLDSNNTIYTAGIGGVFAIQPDLLSLPKIIPSILITQNTTPVIDGAIIQVDFDISKYNFNIEPIILTDQNLFAIDYQINKSSWQVITEPTNIEIDLPYGRTLFKIRICNLVNNQTEIQTVIIVRNHPFWYKPWFIITLIILFILLLIGLYSIIRFIQTKRKMKRLLVERKVEQERLRISSELHDNIGARLTHIISSLDIEMYKQEEETGIASINQFARETMSQLRETIWAVSNQSIYYSVFIKRVGQYVTQVDNLAKPNISFESQIQSDYEMSPTAVINYYRIVQEGINNAIKYANAKLITVHVIELNDYAIITITDDGRGMDLNAPILGSGIQGMKNRANEVNAELIIDSNVNQGTKITL